MNPLRAGIGALSVSLVLALWWWATATGKVSPFVLPPPDEVLNGFVRLFQDGYMGAPLWEHFTASLTVVLGGFLAAAALGVPLGVLMGWSPAIDRLFGPLLTILRPIPPPAWIPLAILWFGIDLTGKVFVVFLSAFVPCLVNAYVGTKETSGGLVQAARMLGAGQRVLLMEVVLPSALPLILTGLRIALGNAWATIVAAELVVATAGFGFLVMNGYRNFEVHVMAVAMIMIGIIGAIMNVGCAYLERRLVRWSGEAR